MAFGPLDVAAWREAIIGDKRFSMCMGAHVINTLLFTFHRLSEQGYLTTFAATVGMYLMAEGVAKFTEAKQNVGA